MNLSDFCFTLDIHETRSQKLFTVRRWDTGRALVITLAEHVGFLGFAPIIDNGTCTVNGRCKSAADGTAIPDDSGGGFLVVERIDEKHVLLFLEQSADMINKA